MNGRWVLEDVLKDTKRVKSVYLNLLISILIICKCKIRQIWSAHTHTHTHTREADKGGQKEPCARMPGQSGGIAVCDSWVAQLGETDNRLSVRADKTPVLGRLSTTSPLLLTLSLSRCTCCSRCPSKRLFFEPSLILFPYNPRPVSSLILSASSSYSSFFFPPTAACS